MAEACDKVHLFFTFSCFTHMLAISFALHAVLHHCGTTSPVLLLPARAALCLSTASHKSAPSFSSQQDNRNPPPPKAEVSHCWPVLPHLSPLCCNCSQNQAFPSLPTQVRLGCPHRGFSGHMGSRAFPSRRNPALVVLEGRGSPST